MIIKERENISLRRSGGDVGGVGGRRYRRIRGKIGKREGDIIMY